MKHIIAIVALVLFAAAHATDTPPALDTPYPGTLRLHVDATDLDHRVFRVREEIPAPPGQLTLLYPQWMPGNHAPRGPADKLAGIVFRANGKPIPWQRDTENVFAFHLDVPQDTSVIEAEFQYLSPADSSQGRVVMTPSLLNLQWNMVALYPAGHFAHQILIAADVRLPAGWQFATALERDGAAGGAVSFRTVDFATLVDSPIFAGRHFRQIDLDPGAKIPVRLNIVADEDRFLDIKPEQVKAHRELVRQAYKLYRSQHYDHYDFLLALSGQLGEIGLEHHRSSENGVPAAYFTEWTRLAGGRDLLPHEYTHSWNGKFRRPAGLATPNFNVPVDAALIWVYEGLTQYWGDVLAARSGLRTQEQARDEIARVAAMYADARPGFAWRDLQDTTTDPVLAQRRPLPYANYQLSEEYYSAGALVWLAVDAKLRELSHERKSLDDFARAFFGIDDGALKVKTYTFDDVVAALNAVAPHDWAAFLRARLDAHVSPLDGIAAAGWRLAYTDTASEYQKNGESVAKVADFAVSIGLTLDADSARITEVIWNSPAFKAGIGPGGTLVAVDGTEYKAEEFTRALQAARTHGQPIELLVKNANRFRTYRVDYHGGPRYPHLERIPGSVDRLGAIYAPR